MQRFIKKLAIAVIITVLLGLVFIAPCFYILPYQTGDLGRLGQISFGPYDTIFKVPSFLYTENITDYASLHNVEILTIGDSFSQGYTIGYQNFTGHYLNKKVSNFRIDGLGSVSTVFTLLEKNMIPNCKIIVIESVERYAINGLSEEPIISDGILNNKIISGTQSIVHPRDTTIRHNVLDFEKLTSYYKNLFNSFSNYKVFTLSAPLFTAGKYSDKLFIYTSPHDNNNDLSFTNHPEEQIQKAKDRLYELKTLGEKYNIQIIYLVAADKYDMYYDYIKDNPYPINPTLSYFSDFDTTFFINTKKILLPHIKNGEKDIYRVNDTHWSVKAAEIVGNHLGRIINESKN